jgi:hypothetical protein
MTIWVPAALVFTLVSAPQPHRATRSSSHPIHDAIAHSAATVTLTDGRLDHHEQEHAPSLAPSHDWLRVVGLKKSTPVRIESIDGLVVTGRTQSIDANGLVIAGPDKDLTIERQAVRRITALRDKGGKYAIRGGVIGAVVALTIAALTDSQSAGFTTWQVAGDAGLGALIGFGIGHGRPDDAVIYEASPN